MVNKCFVLMPFKQPFNDYYKKILVPAIKAAGFTPVRADEIYGARPIIDDIFREIREAAVLVADVSGKNPNVNYELGIAHALERVVIIISQSENDVPFDYRHRRVYLYDTKETGWEANLRTNVTKNLKKEVGKTPTKMESVESLLGFKRIHKNRTEIQLLDLVNKLKAGSELKILGISVSDFHIPLVQMAIKKKLNEGCKVKLLLLDSESDFVRQRADEEKREYSQLHVELVNINKLHKSDISRLPVELRQNIELGQYDAPASYLMFITDSKMIVGFYLRGGQGEYAPHLELEIKENGVYEAFEKHFDSLWETTKKA